jgi:hypothetical protein
VQYPEGWDHEDGDPYISYNIVTFFAPSGRLSGPYPGAMNVNLDPITNVSMTLEQYAQEIIDSYKRDLVDFQLVENVTTTTTLGSDDGANPAYKFTYTERIPEEDNIVLKTMEIGTIVGNKVYFIQYFAEESLYQKHLPTVEKMVDTLQIEDMIKPIDTTSSNSVST